MSSSLRLLTALAVSLLSVVPPTFAATPAPAEKNPGLVIVAGDYVAPVKFSAEGYVMTIAGDLPIVLTSPHGGRLKPDTIPNRTVGSTDMDANTLELAHAVAHEFFFRTGHRIHLVASLLHRIKLDPNREIKEAAQGSPLAEGAWSEYHAAIRGALAAAIARHGFAFLVDLHGHSHPIARLELGYALDAKQLNRSDAAFDAAGLIAVSTFSDLHARLGGSASTLLRGPGSLGELFAARGLRATPSPQDPQPGNGPFFAGGYTVREHAAGHTPKVDGLQIECHRIGVRDTEENRTRFAKIAAEALTLFVEAHYPFKFPTKK